MCRAFLICFFQSLQYVHLFSESHRRLGGFLSCMTMEPHPSGSGESSHGEAKNEGGLAGPNRASLTPTPASLEYVHKLHKRRVNVLTSLGTVRLTHPKPVQGCSCPAVV